MAKTYKGSLTLEWYNKQKSILLANEENKKDSDIPAPKINWINKEEALFYEINEEEGKGVSPYWVDRNDIRVKEARPLIFQKGYKAVEVPKEGSLTEKEWAIEEVNEDTEDIENILIKGDNLLALNTLKKIFDNKPDEQKVKCIYIDPPYKTGNAFKNYDDNLKHSEWLTMMRDRLEILQTLLKEDGVIFISCDDYEQAYLKILCDLVFGESNFIANLPTIMNLKGNNDEFGFAGTHEYTIVYAKNKPFCKLNNVCIDEEELDKWSQDERGYFKKGAILRATGEESKRKDRPKMFYPILVNKITNEIKMIETNEYTKLYCENLFNDEYLKTLEEKYAEEYYFVLPLDGDEYSRWRWGWNEENKLKWKTETIINLNGKNITFYKKQRPELGDIPSKKPKSIFYKSEYSSGTGTSQIKEIFGKKLFDYPKPFDLIKDFLLIGASKNDIILDCFGGSGTTYSVAQTLEMKYIGVEVGNQMDELIIPRLKKTIVGNKAGIGFINYTGGGSFKYYHLGESIISDNDFNWKLGKTFIQESFLSSYDYIQDKDINLNEGMLFTQNNLPTIGVQKIGNKTTIAVVSLNAPGEINLMMKQEEIEHIYKSIKNKYSPEYINIFTNRGVEIAYDSKPDNLEIIKIPHAIFAELER